MVAPVLAGLATIPVRRGGLERCLAALRPQVDRLHVVCHDVKEPPPEVREYADEWVCMPDAMGSAAKLIWAREWDGIYLACDDDMLYPPDYAEVMRSWVEKWERKALVTCHARVIPPRYTTFPDAKVIGRLLDRNDGGWANYPGGGAMAFHTDLRIPMGWPKNSEETVLAVWAQRRKVPIWLVPHEADWLQYLDPPGDTIWDQNKRTRFARHDEQLGIYQGWTVHRP